MQKNKFLLILIIFASCSSQPKEDSKVEEIAEIPKVLEVDAPDKEVEIDVYATDSIVENAKNELIEEKPLSEEKVQKPTSVKPKAATSKIVVEAPNYSFGRVIEGDVVNHTFTFKNEGKADLIIKDVLVDCGCTVPEFPKEAIPVGESSDIKVTFNTKGKMGNQERFITILTNGEPRSKIVKLIGIVDTE